MKWKFINKQSSSTTRYAATEYYGMLILPYEMIHIWSPWKLSNFHEPSPFTCPFMCKIILPPAHWSWTSNFTQTCPITHIFSTHFANSLFYLYNLKTYTNYGTTTALCIWTLWINNCTVTVHVNVQNQNKNKTKSCHIQNDHRFYCSI